VVPQNVQLGMNRYARQLIVPRGDAHAEKYRRQHVKFYPDAPATYVTFQMFVDTHGLGNSLLTFARELATKRAQNRRTAERQSAKIKAEKERAKAKVGRRRGSALGSVMLAFKNGEKGTDGRTSRIVSLSSRKDFHGMTSIGRKYTESARDLPGSASICPLHPVKDAQNKVIPKSVLDSLLVRSGYIVTTQPTEAGVIIVSDSLEQDQGAYRKYGAGVVKAWSAFVRKFGFKRSAWDTATSRVGAYAIDDMIADDTDHLLHPEAESGMSVGAFEMDGDDADSMDDGFEVAVDDGSDVAAGGGGGMDDASEAGVGGRRKTSARKPKKKKSSARAKGAYPQFVRKFSTQHRGEYGNGSGQKPQTQMMKDAAKAWKKHKAAMGR